MSALPATAPPTAPVTGPPPASSAASPQRPAVVLRRAPRREPLFDDELVGRRLRLAGPFDQPLPFGDVEADREGGHSAASGVAQRTAAVPRRPNRHRDAEASGSLAGPEAADPAAWSRRLLTMMFETVAGHRAARQLAPLLSPAVATAFTGRTARTGRMARMLGGGIAPTIRSVHVGVPASGVAEVAATVAVGPRVHAIALRLEDYDGRWRCVRLQVG